MCEHIRLSSTEVELEGTKDWYSWNIILIRNGKIHSILGSTPQKYASNQKKLQIKVLQNWILYQKVRERVYLHPHPPPQSRARRLKRLIWLKYYFIPKRQNTFNFGLNTRKIRIKSKKLQIKVLQNWILYHKVRERVYLYPPPSSKSS